MSKPAGTISKHTASVKFGSYFVTCWGEDPSSPVLHYSNWMKFKLWDSHTIVSLCSCEDSEMSTLVSMQFMHITISCYFPMYSHIKHNREHDEQFGAGHLCGRQIDILIILRVITMIIRTTSGRPFCDNYSHIPYTLNKQRRPWWTFPIVISIARMIICWYSCCVLSAAS